MNKPQEANEAQDGFEAHALAFYRQQRKAWGDCAECGELVNRKGRCYACYPKSQAELLYEERCAAQTLKRRIDLVNQYGGKCQECGKDDDPFRLHLHHKDGAVKGGRQRIKPVEREVEKYPERFVLLCRTCHGIAHRAPKEAQEA